MPDVVDAETRSRMMSGIRGRNTKPEMIVRHLLHRKGFRYRLHVSSMPGKPDLVMPRHRAVVLVNGCFWHGHDCHLFKWPSTRPGWWRAKIDRTRETDREAFAALKADGWRIAIVWECALKGRTRLGVDEVADQLSQWLLSKSQEDVSIEGTRP